jgi:hypothetical protein
MGWWKGNEIEPEIEVLPPVPEPEPQTLEYRAEKYVNQAEAMVNAVQANHRSSGVAKRHSVYKKLVYANPEASRSDIGLAIELAVQKLKKEPK